MTQEEFIGELEEMGLVKGDDYSVKDGTITIYNKGSVNLSELTSIPQKIIFRNGGNIYLESVTSIPSDVFFCNGGDVFLTNLTSIPRGVEFHIGWGRNYYLPNLFFESIMEEPFMNWKGNIKEIDPMKILNLMIGEEIFERK